MSFWWSGAVDDALQQRSGNNKMVAPYAPGSNTDRLWGFGRMCSCSAMPAVRVENIFVKAARGFNTLEIEVSVSNQNGSSDSDRRRGGGDCAVGESCGDRSARRAGA